MCLAEIIRKNGRKLLIVALSILLVISIFAGKIQNTRAYMTAKSGDCINTFQGENMENTTESTVPSDPTEPDKPTDPTVSDDPTKPEEPTAPSDPTKPEEPTAPSNPTKPDEPIEPTDPSDAAESSDSMKSTDNAGTENTSVGQTDPSTTQDENIKTEDRFHMGVWGTTALISLIALIATVLYKPRKRKKE